MKNEIQKLLRDFGQLTLDNLWSMMQKPRTTIHDNLKQLIAERIIGKKDSERREIRRGRSPVVYFILPNIS
jgi:predicted transcriptional regulator